MVSLKEESLSTGILPRTPEKGDSSPVGPKEN